MKSSKDKIKEYNTASIERGKIKRSLYLKKEPAIAANVAVRNFQRKFLSSIIVILRQRDLDLMPKSGVESIKMSLRKQTNV